MQRSAADLYCSLDLIALRLDVVSKGEIGSNISHKITMNYTTIPMRSKSLYISHSVRHFYETVFEIWNDWTVLKIVPGGFSYLID